MKTAQTGAAGAVPRRLLLFAVLAGLILMHTLGHTVHEGHIPSPASSAPVMTFTGPAGAHAAHGGGTARPAEITMRGAGVGDGIFDPLAVCLAVLLAAPALLLMRAVRLGGLFNSGVGGGRSHHFALPRRRGPPPTGLQLTRTAVLRI